MQVVVSVREGTETLTQASLDTYHTITSFSQLLQDAPDSPVSPLKKARMEAQDKGKEVKYGDVDTEKNGSEKDGERAPASKKDEEERKEGN